MQMVANGYGVTLVPEVALDVEVRDELQRGLSRLFALSTQAFVYLEQKGGFVEAGPEILPPKRREKYEASGRNSRVLVKDLQPNPDVPPLVVAPEIGIGNQWLVTRNA